MTAEPLVLLQKQRASNNHNETPITIGIHSRHRSTTDDGLNINHEKKCFDTMMTRLYEHHNDTRPCVAYLISDRQTTIESLSDYIHTNHRYNCSVIVPDHENRTKHEGLRSEHGPWAGLGFWEDAVLVSTARHGFLQTKESSASTLIKAFISYDRVVESAIKQKLLPPPLEGCQYT
jgi:hypothetical protein